MDSLFKIGTFAPVRKVRNFSCAAKRYTNIALLAFVEARADMDEVLELLKMMYPNKKISAANEKAVQNMAAQSDALLDKVKDARQDILSEPEEPIYLDFGDDDADLPGEAAPLPVTSAVAKQQEAISKIPEPVEDDVDLDF